MNHLLLVGIDKYQHHKPLNDCVKDLKDFKEILLEKFDFQENNVCELYDENASNKNIQDTFKKYIKELEKDSNLIIYFSGHGGLEKTTNRGFWIPQEAHSENYTTWLPNETILTFISEIKSKHVFLVSDCCFSLSLLISSGSKSSTDYYNFPSRWALTSGENLTYDGPKGENSFFADCIISYLKQTSEDIRVGKLIEYVKEKFSTSKLQSPQGYPFQDTKHQGGEFVFKIVNNEVIDDRQIKGYNDFLCVLKNYKRNSTFIERGRFGDKEGDKKSKIGYQIFQEEDKVLNSDIFYLYLFEGINQKQTLEHLKLNHSYIFTSKNLIILLPIERNQINLAKRKQNIEDKFKPRNIFYIEDFIRDLCTPKNLTNNSDDNFLDIPNFILPYYQTNKIIYDNIDFFETWLDNINEPLLVLKGEGGIGKTTFAQFIADKFLRRKPKSSVLFIDSGEIKTELIKMEKSFENINVYNFYEALHETTDFKYEKLSEDLFRINLDAGNFLLIIDGLDEVISKVPNFVVEDFLSSILKYTSEIGNGKIIITCRSYFWDVSKYNSNQIKTIELLPFDSKKTKMFFEKSFHNDSKKVNKALKIADEFKISVENMSQAEDHYIFHPYVLDVVRSIVESNGDIINVDNTFNSDILEKTVKNDYIIYRICYRERLRVEQLSVDDQLKFFSYWAIKRRGVISLDNFSKEIQGSINKHVDNVNLKAFKAHPFIRVNDKIVKFKYDFFADYFKHIYVSRHLTIDGMYDTVSEDFLKILVENCWYGSGMITEIRDRLIKWNDDDLLKCSDLISQILNDKNLLLTTKRMSIAGIFNICLALNLKSKSNSIDHNTGLLQTLFGNSQNELVGFQLIGLHNNKDEIKFNFSNLTMKDCYIDGYQSFWNCIFNENTYFENSFLLNLNFDSKKRIPIPLTNFRNCTKDDKFNLAFRKDSLNLERTDLQVREFLEDFFKLFFSKGRLERQGYHDFIKRRFKGISQNHFDFEVVMKFFEKQDMFEYFKEYTELKVKIKDKFKSDVIKFIKDGTMSKFITDLISSLNHMTSN